MECQVHFHGSREGIDFPLTSQAKAPPMVETLGKVKVLLSVGWLVRSWQANVQLILGSTSHLASLSVLLQSQWRQIFQVQWYSASFLQKLAEMAPLILYISPLVTHSVDERWQLSWNINPNGVFCEHPLRVLVPVMTPFRSQERKDRPWQLQLQQHHWCCQSHNCDLPENPARLNDLWYSPSPSCLTIYAL